jgi:hypothetical protein
MSLTFAETPNGTPVALRADFEGRLDTSWDYTRVSTTGVVHAGPCMLVGYTPVQVGTSLVLTIRDGTGSDGQLLVYNDVSIAQVGYFVSCVPLGGARLRNGLYVEVDGAGSLLIWWRRA